MEPFTISRQMFTQGGRARRTACGMITYQRRFGKVRPMALAASICPAGTDCSAPRRFSATCAVAKADSAITPAAKGVTFTLNSASP